MRTKILIVDEDVDDYGVLRRLVGTSLDPLTCDASDSADPRSQKSLAIMRKYQPLRVAEFPA